MRSIPIKPDHLILDQDQGDEVDLLKWLNALWRGKWRIAFWALVAGAAAVYYIYAMTVPLYTATSTVALQNRSEKIVDLATPLSGLGGDYFTINTEVSAMTSRELIGKLVDKEGLVDDPAFNYALRPARTALTPGTVIGWVKGAVTGLVLPTREKAPAAPLTPEEARAKARESVINTVMGMISVTNLRTSYVFYITVTADDPEAAMRLANAMAETYIENQIAIKYEATEQATLWLNRRLGELKVELDRIENNLKAFSSKTDLVGPEALAALNRQLKDRRDRVGDARTAASGLAARVSGMEAARTEGDPAAMAAIAGDPGLDAILARIDTDGARQGFETRFERLLERARFEARQGEAKVAALERSVSELEAQVKSQSAELLELQQLEREAAASRQIYEYFLGRQREISVQQGIHRPDSRLLSQAVLPLAPSSPRKMFILVSAMLAGALIGTVLVLVRELRSSEFRSPQDLEEATGMTVLGQVPRAPVANRRKLVRYLTTKPTSALAESVRNLRTSVMLSNVDHPPQVIMITSSLPGEGKTTQSLALAQSFAKMDRRVLLIEGDIRRRTFREYFRIRDRAGLIQAVLEETPLAEAAHYSEELGIDVLVGEKSTLNAADFFSSAKIQKFLARARQEYDIIIIDTPPVLIVPDARMIGQLADAVLYVVRWNQTTRVQVEEGLKSLATVDVKVSGLVMSQVDVRKASYYGGRYREIYSNYGSKYYRN